MTLHRHAFQYQSGRMIKTGIARCRHEGTIFKPGVCKYCGAPLSVSKPNPMEAVYAVRK